MVHTWSPARFTLGTLGKYGDPVQWNGIPFTLHPYALIQLNHSNVDEEVEISLLQKARFIALADGASNRYGKLLRHSSRYPRFPNVVCGDLDSQKESEFVKWTEAAEKTRFAQDADLDTTDFMKCLNYASEEVEGILNEYRKQFKAYWGYLNGVFPGLGDERPTTLDLVVLGGLGGRADHAFSQIHHLFLASEDLDFNFGDIYLLADDSIMFLLHKGVNVIHTPVRPWFFTNKVGIIPIGRPAVISTRGLQWDVENWSTEFGTKMSTSNEIKNGVVKVKTTERVLFTMQLAPSPGKEQDPADNVNSLYDYYYGILETDDDTPEEDKGKKHRNFTRRTS